jgi:predicted hydrocarbon binding protein
MIKTMSLLEQHFGTTAPLPRLTGKEVLVGADPSVCKVKGVMFGGRKQFLVDALGEQRFNELCASLSPKTAQNTRTPLASSWCDFGWIVELDRAIHESMHREYPNILALIGAASAELGIGKVYKMLDNAELTTFLEKSALFHNQYQKFGSVRFEKTAEGGRMIYGGYPCYSPIYCASASGFFIEAILRHGGTDPKVVETTCQTLGDASCTYEMTWR